MTATTPQTLPLNVALQQAVAHHQAGRLQEAEQLYRAILQARPGQPDANHNLGVLAVQVGQHAVGLPYLKTALAINPDHEQYALSYADALLATGQAEEALNVLRAAMQRGLNAPAVHALWQRAEADALDGSARGEIPTHAEMNQLVTLFNAGRHAELESRARLLLEQYPESGFAWKVLGVALQEQGKDALPALRKATELLPDDAEAHNNLGNALKDLGQLDDALTSYRRALEIKPDYVETHFNLGMTLKSLGQLDGAVASYRRVLEIKPDFAEAHNNLGVALKDLGQLDGAVASCRRALEIKPDFAEAHSNLGNALKDLGQLDDAVASYRRALEIKPELAMAHSNLGNALKDLGQLDNAVASYRRALQIKPDYTEAHNYLGIALQDLGQLDGAAASFRRALEIKPDYAEAHSNLGNALRDIGRLDDAIASYRRALAILPDYAEALSNMGIALSDLGQFDDAVANYRRALEIKSDLAAAHFNLGLCLLGMGRHSEGWREYEYRCEGDNPRPPRTAISQPQWIGQQHPSNDRLLVFEEQGMGDRLQFVRYLPLAADRFAGVSLVSGSPLLALFRRSFPGVEILDAIPADQSAWQWQCPLLSLPLAFETTLETIPKQVPYLVPDPLRVAFWRARIAALGLSAPTHKIGVVWKTGNAMKNAPMRSLTLQQLAPLLNLPGCAWFSLQKEPDPDKALWVTSGKLIDWAEEFGDFDETAALAMNLDLIVSVDTAVAHLAGGLGRPTWLFNRHASEWRWMHDREDSPWYPTMRIFNQKKAGEWDEVVRRMAAALTSMPPQLPHSKPA